MPDVFTKRKRSEVMSRIRGRGNMDTEVALAKLLRAHGVKGWRRQQRVRIEGKKRRAGTARPTNVAVDFIFPKERVVVFVDGCFWHGCPIHSSPAKWIGKSSMGRSGGRIQKSGASSQKPRGKGSRRTGKEFWAWKMAANMARDRLVNRELRRAGWNVIRIWEHRLKNPDRVIKRIRKVIGKRG